MSLSLGSISLTFCESIIISPLSEFSRPAIVFNKVDFPHPDGPSKTKKSPSFISKFIPFKTSV